jgi:hypothetical protein
MATRVSIGDSLTLVKSWGKMDFKNPSSAFNDETRHAVL